LASTLEPTSRELKLTAAALSLPAMPVLVAGGGNAGGASGVDAAVPLGGGVEGTGEFGSPLLPHATSASAVASDAASIRGCRVVFMEAPLFVARNPVSHEPLGLHPSRVGEFVAMRVEQETSAGVAGKLATTGSGGGVNTL
jgi:hypothetical protein